MNDDKDFIPGSSDEEPTTASAETPTDAPDADDDRPLGYWFRVIAGLSRRDFFEALEAEDIDPREWMLLKALSHADEVPGLSERLARRGKAFRSLEERGWVDQAGDGSWSLTDEGREAQQRLSATMGDLRGKLAGAIPAEDMAKLRDSLESVARELGWEEGMDMPRHGRHGFGPRGRDFGKGFGRGFGGGRGFRPGFGPGSAGFGPWAREGFGPGAHTGFGPGHEGDPRFDRDAWQHVGHPHDRGFEGDRWSHGHHGHPHHRGHGDARKAQRKAEKAYERGFAAGFAAAQRPAQSPVAPEASGTE
jgi:DNA-binding MarR family transcriptional regulator